MGKISVALNSDVPRSPFPPSIAPSRLTRPYVAPDPETTSKKKREKRFETIEPVIVLCSVSISRVSGGILGNPYWDLSIYILNHKLN